MITVESNQFSEDTSRALNPELWRLMSFVGMDRALVRGDGVWLYDEQGRAFLDCFSQYGAVALGHNHPAVVEAIQRALRDQRPAMIQPYAASHAVALADRLVALAPPGLAHCVFTTSGAETVEAALKIVRAHHAEDPRRRLVVSTRSAYHGKTLGAIMLSDRHRDDIPGVSAVPGVAFVPFGDADALAALLVEHPGEVAAFIVEPIQGEAGVVLPPAGYLRRVRELCTSHGVALIFDEIQTGLGRTGRLFRCQVEDVAPDLLLLSKALGGGVFPIGACLVSHAMWSARFALVHSSTFANNNLACAVGQAVLDELTGGLCEAAAERGAQLMAGLQALRQRYPRVVADVRGAGLLTAIELHPISPDAGYFLSYLYHQGLLVYGLASFLGERESVLMLPTLGNPNVLRICPPLTINEGELARALASLNLALGLLDSGATDALVRDIARLGHGKRMRYREPLVAPTSRVRRVTPHPTYAFLGHYTADEDIVTNDPALRRLSPTELADYSAFMANTPPGVVVVQDRIVSAAGASAEGWLISLGMLPREMMRRGRAWVGGEIRRAVDLATELGARVVGLGAYTTIFSRRGADVVGRGPYVTTGNSLTAGMAMAAIERVCEQRGLAVREARVAVVGARGSVGSLCAKLIARRQPRLLRLIGHRSPVRELARLRDELAAISPGTRIEVGFELDQLSDCDLILSATSAVRPVLDDAPIRSGAIVCDIARPYDTDRLRARRDVTVIDGGLVNLPDPRFRFGVGNVQGLPSGVQLACLSETILLTLAGESRDFGIGDDVPLSDVDRVMQLAELHGFTLAEPLAAADQARRITAT
jgi:acetylornithine/succinyldiaminopimelate/putrescine aminotransferase/predicted amino acid dehydrogenase